MKSQEYKEIIDFLNIMSALISEADSLNLEPILNVSEHRDLKNILPHAIEEIENVPISFSVRLDFDLTRISSKRLTELLKEKFVTE